MKTKEMKGITLVALVVTIVVLLILAGVSINSVLGENGIIIKAKEAAEKTAADPCACKYHDAASLKSASQYHSLQCRSVGLYHKLCLFRDHSLCAGGRSVLQVFEESVPQKGKR